MPGQSSPTAPPGGLNHHEPPAARGWWRSPRYFAQLMRNISPPWPTATQLRLAVQLTPVSCTLALPPAATWLVQAAPASAVVRTVPWSPTAAQKLVLGQLTPRRTSPLHREPLAQSSVMAVAIPLGELEPLRMSSNPGTELAQLAPAFLLSKIVASNATPPTATQNVAVRQLTL